MAPPDPSGNDLPPLALDEQLRRFSRRASALLTRGSGARPDELDDLRVSGFALAVLVDSAVGDLECELAAMPLRDAELRRRGRGHLALRRLRREARSLRVYLHDIGRLDDHALPSPPAGGGDGRRARIRGV